MDTVTFRISKQHKPYFDHPMNADILEAWATALMSGRYEQCMDTLYDGDGYCCLGVAECEINHKDPKKIEGFGTPKSLVEDDYYNYDKSSEEISEALADLLHLYHPELPDILMEEVNFKWDVGDLIAQFDSLNDIWKLTFKEIAELIVNQTITLEDRRFT